MARPKLLLLDEPMAGINPTLGKRLLDHMQRLRQEEGVTFLFIEHDMEVVMNHSDRVVVMAEGRVIADGEPHEVRKDRRVIDAYLGGGAGATRRPGRSRRDEPTPTPTAPCSTVEDLVAGYVPEVDILTGVDLTVRGGRDRHGDRPERRRQVDPDQVDLRAAAAPARAGWSCAART